LTTTSRQRTPPSSRVAPFGDDLPTEKPAAGAANQPPPAAIAVWWRRVAAAGGCGRAAAVASPANVKGFVQNRDGLYWKDPAHWSEMMTHFDLSAQGQPEQQRQVEAGARIDYDAVYTLTDFYPQAVENDQRFNVLLRENYLDIGAGDWDFRLGRQQVVWGEMVGLLFGDVVSAKDVRQFVLPEFDILRIPQWAARAEYFKDDFHAEFLWIPVASYDNIGKPGAEFYAYTPPPPPGSRRSFSTRSFRRAVCPTPTMACGCRCCATAGTWPPLPTAA
jgi:hypothetical protein